MQYFIDSGNNIDSADQMFEAMQSATALCGFTAIVLDIRGQKYAKQTHIKNISKIHHVKYIYDDTKNEYQMWQFSEIGQGKKYEVKGHPVAPFYEEKMPFFLMLETVLVPFRLKARMRLIFHALIKLVF